ncbi:PTS transporter subunit EIIC [Paenibacillus sp. CGMCC 1.18879]|uniref:PTS transporter subunit EIIC n=2 Tax=Paenibacillus TaxID=44249 RepID=UPI001CA90F37|nr:PTS transporter subunit EIIC [Paenibacillus sp. CGMCC 1.18879]MBY9077350.1 PTS transporter subunit EIIC [Paenibacillus sp. CGMCC 1.18879]
MSYEKLVKGIVEGVGGKDNIDNVYHCATRLRFTLHNESNANDEAVKSLDGVISLVKSAGQYQVIIGQHVGEVHKELMSQIDPEENEDSIKDASLMKEEMKEKKVKSGFIDLISGIFTPVLGMLIATGVIKGFLALLTATGLLSMESGTYQLLAIIGDCFFHFMPVFLGYTAMKKFGGSPFIGVAIGAALIYPSISTIMAGEPLYTMFSGTIFESPVHISFLGIPVILMNYGSTVFPVVAISYLASKFEKFFNKHIGSMFKSLAVPALTLILSLLVGFLLVGPIVSFASNLLGAFFGWIFTVSPTISGFLYGALIQLCVVFGVHWGFVAISINNMATIGYDPVTITGLSSAFAQAGVVTVILILTKNKKLKSISGPAILSAMFGITEPAIYGITLQNRRAFILASLSSGIGGAIMGFAGVKQYFYGTNGVFGWLQVINTETGFDSSVVASIIACVLSFVVSVVLMWLFGKKSIDMAMK